MSLRLQLFNVSDSKRVNYFLSDELLIKFFHWSGVPGKKMLGSLVIYKQMQQAT